MNARIQPIDVTVRPLPHSMSQFQVAADTIVKSVETATPVTVAFGDGIGPEIMNACLKVLLEAGAKIAVEPIHIGERLYKQGETSGIDSEAWQSIQRTRVLYKAPITTPQGGGLKSVNVTLRKSLGLFANVRPCTAYHPFVATKHPGMDVVIIRENEEDLYAGIEHRQTDDVYQCLKLVSRPGCERIVHFAFQYALRNGRRKVSCFTKDNIMKLTDGLFHKVFDEVAVLYPQIENEHWIVDAGAAQLADDPCRFDVIVMPNLYGDILSDVGAEISGSIGLAASANIGSGFAMFEAVHGSAPALAGRDLANPSGLLGAGVMMLSHIGQAQVAERVHNAWLKTLEDGIHTFDMFGDGVSKQEAGTKTFTRAVIRNLGNKPQHLRPAERGQPLPGAAAVKPTSPKIAPAVKELVGIDVFVHWRGQQVRALAETMRCAQGRDLELTMISNRGVKVWPAGIAETLKTDHWRCRYMARQGKTIDHAKIANLQMELVYLGIDFIKTEHLYNFDGQPGFSLGQGQ
ncbi:MAG: NADP-dependent isocitrate dehydrogenase [Xanthobacteraceae bacterium]|nr:NADP-dependent isocitrate dehydrogenase [Xanthobacteraceae bacterium]